MFDDTLRPAERYLPSHFIQRYALTCLFATSYSASALPGRRWSRFTYSQRTFTSPSMIRSVPSFRPADMVLPRSNLCETQLHSHPIPNISTRQTPSGPGRSVHLFACNWQTSLYRRLHHCLFRSSPSETALTYPPKGQEQIDSLRRQARQHDHRNDFSSKDIPTRSEQAEPAASYEHFGGPPKWTSTRTRLPNMLVSPPIPLSIR